jgi:GAF domain-containing protein
MSPTPDSTLANLKTTIDDLQRQLAERTRQRDEALVREAAITAERDEALAQQTATAEVLQVINASPGDLAPVFDAMLDSALGLCEAAHGNITTFDGEAFRITAIRGAPPPLVEFFEKFGAMRPDPETTMARLADGEDVVQITDTAAEGAYNQGYRRTISELSGCRTLLAVALRKDRRLLGQIAVFRREVRPFTDKQIALLQNFAAQAVIAMENARLITETREALEQQTATAEVLGVINSSPGDLTPVFDAMLDKATALCDAAFGIMSTWDGERFHRVAFQGASAELIEALREPNRPIRGSMAEQFFDGVTTICAADIREQGAYQAGAPVVRALVDIGGARSYAMVALNKDGKLLGAVTVYRREIRPFSDQKIALLQNFAAQAVIAMENARLIIETREALDQQTATAEVLGVINASPGDLTPVFDAMLERANRVCDADVSTLWTFEGDQFFPVAVSRRHDPGAIATQIGWRPSRSVSLGRLLAGEELVHVLDVRSDPGYQSDAEARARTNAAGARTILTVALRKDGRLLGAITTGRQVVSAYSEKQIALLQNFAAQAVIAIENARLITETRESL